MKLIIIITINIEKKKKFVQNLKWATAHLSSRRGRWARGRVAGGWARAGSGTARALQAKGARACGAGGAQARGMRGAHGRRGAGAGRAQGTWQARGLGAGRAAGRWARGRQALGARGARGLGAWAGLGQCTRCTRPIFDPF